MSKRRMHFITEKKKVIAPYDFLFVKLSNRDKFLFETRGSYIERTDNHPDAIKACLGLVRYDTLTIKIPKKNLLMTSISPVISENEQGEFYEYELFISKQISL